MLGRYRVHKPLKTRVLVAGAFRFPGLYYISGVGQGGGGGGGSSSAQFESAGFPGGTALPSSHYRTLRNEFPTQRWEGGLGWGGVPGGMGNSGSDLVITTSEWSVRFLGGWGGGTGATPPPADGVPSGWEGGPGNGKGGRGGQSRGPGITGTYGGWYAELRG